MKKSRENLDLIFTFLKIRKSVRLREITDFVQLGGEYNIGADNGRQYEREELESAEYRRRRCAG